MYKYLVRELCIMKNSLIKQLVLLFLISCILYGCSSGKKSVTSQSVSIGSDSNIYMDEIGSMPILAPSSHPSYTVRIHNHSNIDYHLASIKVTKLNTHKEQKDLLNVKSLTANFIAANHSSSISITPNTKYSGSVLLVITLKSSQGKYIELKKIIRIEKYPFAEQAIISEKSLNLITNSADGAYSIALPVLLDKNFDRITTNKGSLECKNYNKGSSCTLFLDGKINPKSQDTIDLELTAYQHSKKYQFGAKVLLSYGDRPNLIIAHKSIISGSKVEVIEITNNGTSIAKNLRVTSKDGKVDIIALSSFNGCKWGADLAVKATCAFNIGISGASRSTEFEVTYEDVSKNPYSLKKKIIYFTRLINPEVDFPNGTIPDTLINISQSVTFGITNNKSLKLSNLTLSLPFDLVSSREFVLEEDPNSANPCKLINATFDLVSNASCQFRIKYTPSTAPTSGTILLNLHGSYTDEFGKQQDYFQILEVGYSSVTTLSPPVVTLEFASGFSGQLDVPLSNSVNTNAKTRLVLRNLSSAPISFESSFVNFNSFPKNRLVATSNCRGQSPILSQDSCQIEIDYGPGRVTESLTLNAIVSFTYNGQGETVDSPPLNLQSANIAVARAALLGLYAYDENSSESLNFAGGDGLSIENPFRVYVFNEGMIGVAAYQITNVSESSFISYFMRPIDPIGVTINSLPAGTLNGVINVGVQPTSCSLVAGSANDFIKDSTCNYNIRFPNASFIGNKPSYELVENNWESGEVKVGMSYFYDGSNTGIYKFNIQTLFFAISRAWIDLDVDIEESKINSDALIITVTGSFVAPSLIQEAEISVNLETAANINISSSQCTFDETKNECTFTATRNDSSIQWSSIEFRVTAKDNFVGAYDNYKIFRGA